MRVLMLFILGLTAGCTLGIYGKPQGVISHEMIERCRDMNSGKFVSCE